MKDGALPALKCDRTYHTAHTLRFEARMALRCARNRGVWREKPLAGGTRTHGGSGTHARALSRRHAGSSASPFARWQLAGRAFTGTPPRPTTYALLCAVAKHGQATVVMSGGVKEESRNDGIE